MYVGWPGPMARVPILNARAMLSPSVNCLMVQLERGHLADRGVPAPGGQDGRESLAISLAVQRAAWLLRRPRRAAPANQRPPGLEQRLEPRMERLVGRPERVR